MKKSLFITLTLVLFATCLSAQATRKDKMLQNRKEFSDRTLFQQFEHKMVPSANERKSKSQENKAKRELLLTMIDTAQIKTDLKLKLQNDVVHNPFSNRLRKFMEKHSLKEKMQLLN